MMHHEPEGDALYAQLALVLALLGAALLLAGAAVVA